MYSWLFSNQGRRRGGDDGGFVVGEGQERQAVSVLVFAARTGRDELHESVNNEARAHEERESQSIHVASESVSFVVVDDRFFAGCVVFVDDDQTSRASSTTATDDAGINTAHKSGVSRPKAAATMAVPL